MAYPGPPRRATGLLRYILLACVALLVLYYLQSSSIPGTFTPTHDPSRASQPISKPPGDPVPHKPEALEETPSQDTHLKDIPLKETTSKETPSKDIPSKDSPSKDIPSKDSPSKDTPSKPHQHPIDGLIEAAETEYKAVLARESHNVNDAAAEYRRRRGRHPPPGFDAWFKFAQDHKGLMVEDFFDQIYHDIGPFWGLPPNVMRREASEYEMTIKIRNHNATAGSTWFWTKIWLNLVKTIEEHLPDMDLALNAMDEPRILTPWEDINGYMEKERASRSLTRPDEVITEYQTLEKKPNPEVEVRKLNFEKTKPFWKLAVRGCPPNSLARKAVEMSDFSHTPDISLKHALPFTHEGYISNFTMSTDFCNQPDIQALHGMMINPLSVSTTKTLFPMFGGSKLPTNNEILLPAPMYWNNEVRFSGGDDHGPPWAEKKDKVIWRGVATGGRNTATNWKGFQRHRFVSQTNGTEISNVESWKQVPQNWAMPPSQYRLAAQEEGKLGEWTKSWSDTAFIDLMCEKDTKGGRCNYTNPYFEVMKGLTMAEQFDCKYLPDIDGNSFSGRYRGFLMSTSLPIKATIFREWHDSRLIPWKHFVPMDNRYLDFWGIMEYFLGYEGKNGVKRESHDKQAEQMAKDGQEWANKVLRPEDMQIYVFRVLLEYARVTDDNREKMGWVADLLE